MVAFISGGLYGFVGYFLLGFLVYAGARAAGSAASLGRARQIVGFAVVPLALSLLVWFVRIAVYGGAPFRTGGSDTGLGNHLFEAIEVAVLLWSGALLVVGLRAYNGWSLARALAAALPALALPALALLSAISLRTVVCTRRERPRSGRLQGLPASRIRVSGFATCATS